MSGLSELMLVSSDFIGKTVREVTYSDMWDFCEHSESRYIELQLIKEYLLHYGPCLIGLLEAQKLTLAMTKELCPLNFTTRGTHYGPDTVGHIRNLSHLSKFEMQIGKQFFTFNRRKD